MIKWNDKGEHGTGAIDHKKPTRRATLTSLKTVCDIKGVANAWTAVLHDITVQINKTIYSKFSDNS